MTTKIELTELDRLLASTLFGAADPFVAIEPLVDAEECFFVGCSAGMVFGLRLPEGSRVALKVLRLRRGLTAAREVQAALHAAGFPCPRPLRGPLPVGRGVAFVDEWADGEQRDMHEPARRRTAAELLAALVAAAPRRHDLPRALDTAGPAAVFPEPHSPRFDFARPDGAWIDEAGRRARAVRDAGAGRDVVGHADWSAKHFGWRGDRIGVVYDWPDSVAGDAEETLVGQASLVFPSTWDLPIEPKLAPPEASAAFVEEYEEAAGRRLDRRRVGAARVYLLAYSARCELSDLGGADGPFQQLLRDAIA